MLWKPVSTALLVLVLCGQAQAQATFVSGRVVDARTRQPLLGVVIHVEHHAAVAETDAGGVFRLPLPAGSHTISVFMIGYAVVRQSIEVTTTPQELVIQLSEGAGAYEERVNVTGLLPRDADQAPAGTQLHGRDLQALRGLMLDDPLRAVQALPAATSTDDFYSEFAVRGSSFRHVGLLIDGIPSRYLMHSIYAVTDGGSIAMINSEALGAASLLPGSYPQRAGRRLGAEVHLSTRDGNRERVQGRMGLSGTSATILVEGPLANGRGTWLASARRSYLDFLLSRIDEEGTVGFGFSDALAKLTFDVSSRHQLQLLTVLGRTGFDENPENLSPNAPAEAQNHSWLSAASWRFTPSPRMTTLHRVYTTGIAYDNVNKTGVHIDRGTSADWGWRSDVTYSPHPKLSLEFGGDAIRSSANQQRRRTFDGSTDAVVVESYDTSKRALSAYALLRAAVGPLTVAPGARLDYWAATRTTSGSPWLTADVRLGSQTRLRAGSGIHRQFPELSHVFGIRAGSSLQPESATHADVAVIHTLGSRLSVQVSGFKRAEQDVLWADGGESKRLADGSVAVGRADAPWANRLTGRARGVEAMLRRDGPAGLSGWLAYAYARHRYTDVVSNEAFWADADQRHTLSLYGLYQLSNRSRISAKFRYGSNYPIVGYVEESRASADVPPLFGGMRPLFYAVSDVRNTLRLPAYARLDVRADRTVMWGGRRITLFGEVANALNRTNVRNVPYSVDPRGRISGVTDSLLPILPSGGLVIEF